MFKKSSEFTNSFTKRVNSKFSDSHCNNLSPNGDQAEVEWTWDAKGRDDFVETFNDHRNVTFHKNHSNGTAVVRGSQPMSEGQHFWEIEMVSPVYGTDMMVGIGTADAEVTQLPNEFVSRLGQDVYTWGFSYTGCFYHNGERRIISDPFDQGSIIGIHLDMWNGTLSLYKNKKHLGVVSKGLKGKNIYAMASSTAACSVMQLLRSCSFPSSLQFLCCARIRDLVPDSKCILSELDIPPGLKQFLESNLGWLLSPRLEEKHLEEKHLPDLWYCRDSSSYQSSDTNPIIVSRERFQYAIFNNFNRPVRPTRLTNEPVFHSTVTIPTSGYADNWTSDVSHNRPVSSIRLINEPVCHSTVMIPEVGIDTWTSDVSHNRPVSSIRLINEPVCHSTVMIPEVGIDTWTSDVSHVSDSESDEDTDEKDAKKCRYSYNYLMGLSDPDSDV